MAGIPLDSAVVRAKYFGKQSFVSKDKTSTTFYAFVKKEEFDDWLKSDIKAFDSGAKKSQRRLKTTEKAFFKHLESGGSYKAFEPRPTKEELAKKFPDMKVTHFDSNNSFSIKKPDQGTSFIHISHPDYKKDFGVVIQFKNDTLKADFLKQHGAEYKGNIKELQATDPRVITAAAHRLFLKHKEKDPDFNITLKSALKNYPQLNPANKHLAVIFQKDFSIPEVYSFEIKPFRDKFVATLKNKAKNENLPIITGKLANFHPIAIDRATKGLILEGNLTDHFRHMKEYLSHHNSKDFKPDTKMEKMTTQSFKESLMNQIPDAPEPLSVPVFKNKDLRSVDFNDSELKGDIRRICFENCSFKGKDLTGVDFRFSVGSKNDFSGTNLSKSGFGDTQFKNCDFKNSHSKDGPADFSNSKLMECDFKYSNHKGIEFSDSKISRSNFYKSELSGGNFERSSLSGSDFNQTNLSKARFDSIAMSKIDGTTFKGANLKNTSLSGSKLDTGPVKTKGPALAK